MDTATRPESVRVPRFGLSGKLLVLTILFVMIAEVLIYVPSIANFRVVWLNDRLATGYTAALVLEAAPNGMVSDSLAKQILDSIGARAVAMKMGKRRRMLAIDDMPPAIDDDFRHAQRHRVRLDRRCVQDDAQRPPERRMRVVVRRRWAATISNSSWTRRRCAKRCCVTRSTFC